MTEPIFKLPEWLTDEEAFNDTIHLAISNAIEREWKDKIRPLHNSPHCSFCGKSYKAAKRLLAGPGVYICNECIRLCHEIIQEEL